MHRYAPWPDLVAELLTSPRHDGFPRRPVEELLTSTFDCTVVWSRRELDGTHDFELAGESRTEPLPTAIVVACETHGRMGDHPLEHWYAATRDSRAMSAGRVPAHIAPRASAALLHDLLAPHDLEQQLAIPFRLEGQEHRAYVLAQGLHDFSDADLALARRIQPLLELLDRQARILDTRRPCLGLALTGRERATLSLLSDGLTAGAIAHRLGVSPRTVNKHLEHLYRKLDVRDRLQAVLVARDSGLLEPAPALEDPPIALPTQRARGGVMTT